ncbi:MAG: tRNA (adenosine(37)-N6)-dimethylallyltransferase MiaA [Candidatus Magasanikbacteria bacterium]|jgi:tRNA dimethylallyltransferase|nr:tRNA (adenosine(37)-N6)-dimethylallyltransferase MiaA [Candidatus Magasanikbacteria bacterium]MBT4220684.1 tRNA (adenosine(37)-N6)-dimethylallyltransferase MiaA [Candidatus Magasanikbacteria bacterium]MBT4350368.1 tRNA (adenosine(37)-N6)-dimethylallyltransferase MiaA [Candidatus Magasanikbacteria bacterium]MBT4541754.1 tRNA (adenosine(37)-N6)-dimethylallyltransferase MiaA [Candidatus Magasanikbacteria bacterium]MBT6252772.1 tRNA (adenosine(37)-N6)-dimethylallyltransferase MiaA [Candidatus Ma
MKKKEGLPKVVVLLGPTASGKTSWSLKLAEKYNGEIISADSRQIYKKMNIGTAKEPGEWRWWFTKSGPRRTYFVNDVPHHLIDFLDPGKRFTVAEFRDQAIKYCKFAHSHGRIPFIVGGTGLYISALVDNFAIPRVPPNKKLRASLEEKSNEDLMLLLEKLDPEITKSIDKKNKRRIIRALEVCIMTGESFSSQRKSGEPIFDILQVGIDAPKELLYDRISVRVDEMIAGGLVEEIEKLLKQKYSWQLPSMSGIGYRQFQKYFINEQSLEETVELLKRDTRRFARRQKTWFKRDTRINWCENFEQVNTFVGQFLKNKQ